MVVADAPLKTLAHLHPSLLSLHRSGGSGGGHLGRRHQRGKAPPDQIRSAPPRLPILFPLPDSLSATQQKRGATEERPRGGGQRKEVTAPPRDPLAASALARG
jgi:hypothetical protein